MPLGDFLLPQSVAPCCRLLPPSLGCSEGSHQALGEGPEDPALQSSVGARGS